MDLIENESEKEVVKIDIVELLHVYLRRWWVILLAAVLFGGVMFVHTKFNVTPLYSSTAKIYVVPSSENGVSRDELTLGANMIVDYQEMIKGRMVLQGAIDKLGINMSYKQLLGSMSLETPEDSRFIYITIRNPDPVLARDIANAVSVEAQSAIKEFMNADKVSITEEAETSSSSYIPLSRNVLIGAVAGAAVVCIILTILYIYNDKIRSPGDVSRYLGMTTLGLIPEGKNKNKGNRF